jgi:SRSO17 transposase
MAERLGADHQGLQQFVSTSTWAVEPVRQRLAARAVVIIAPDAWVVDDTGFPKFGTASPGVARQYSGTLGKVANCQIGVSVHAVTDAASCSLDWRLFLPAGWDDAEDVSPQGADEQAAAAIRVRRTRAAIPEAVRHRPTWRLALDMLAELADWGLRPPVVVAVPRKREVPPAGYGNNAEFRAGIVALGSCSVVQVEGDLTAHPAEAIAELTPYSGRGPHPKPRYRTKAGGLREHALVIALVLVVAPVLVVVHRGRGRRQLPTCADQVGVLACCPGRRRCPQSPGARRVNTAPEDPPWFTRHAGRSGKLPLN